MAKVACLFTGATGALGSMVLPRMLARGYRVYCLVREKDGVAPQARINALTGGDPNAIAIQGDVEKPCCGVNDRDKTVLRGDASFMLHGAASINFESQDVGFRTNVEGVKNVLELAETIGVRDFRHISTAYIAGNARKFAEHDLYVTQSLPNTYAHTKLAGETIVRAWAHSQDDRAFTVFRPSILVGCEDGTTRDFNTYYGYMYPYFGAAEAVRRRAKAGKPLPKDIVVGPDGHVTIRLVARMSNVSTLNLVTTDWVADTMVDLLGVSPRNETYHIVHPRPPRVREVLNISLQYLNMDGIEVVENEADYRKALKEQSQLLSIMQSGMDRIHDQYYPYVNFEPRFGMENTRRALGKKFREPPAIDQALIERLLAYAIDANWGRNKEEKKLKVVAA